MNLSLINSICAQFSTVATQWWIHSVATTTTINAEQNENLKKNIHINRLNSWKMIKFMNNLMCSNCFHQQNNFSKCQKMVQSKWIEMSLSNGGNYFSEWLLWTFSLYLFFVVWFYFIDSGNHFERPPTGIKNMPIQNAWVIRSSWNVRNAYIHLVINFLWLVVVLMTKQTKQTNTAS